MRGSVGRPLKSEPGSGSHALDCVIKWFCAITGGGYTNDKLVSFCADPGFAEDDFHVCEVPGLNKSMTPVGSNVGCVAFTRTRNGNAKFYTWLNMVYLLPFLKRIKMWNNCKDAFMFMFFDGEQVQNNIYFDDELLGLYNELNLILGKLAASTSAIAQACDAWKVFSTLKHYIGTTTKDDVAGKASLKDLVHQRCVILNYNAVVATEMTRLEALGDSKSQRKEQALMGAEDMSKALKKELRDLELNRVNAAKKVVTAERKKRKLEEEVVSQTKK
jgi:hypothetical protein